MRVLITTTGPDRESLPGEQDPEGMAAIGRFHEELAAAGVLLAAGQLQPTSKAARVRFDGDARTVVDGPFTEAKEYIAGYWLWQVRSLDEAVEWLKRAPFQGGEFEVRQIVDEPVPGAG